MLCIHTCMALALSLTFFGSFAFNQISQPEIVTPETGNIQTDSKPLIQDSLAALNAVRVPYEASVSDASLLPLIPIPAQVQVQLQPAQSGLQVQPQGQSQVQVNPTKLKTIELTSLASNYGNDETVIELDYSSINDEILKKNTANFVYFNANFNQCRHCYKFFNIWKDLANDIKWWRGVIKLFVINCSDEDNVDTCRNAGVTQFPQIKYYWIMSSSLEQDGQRLWILGKSVHAMRHLIVDKVMDSYMSHNNFPVHRKLMASAANAMTNVQLGSTNNVLKALLSPLIGQILNGTGSGTTGGKSHGFGSIINALSGKDGSLAGLLSGLGGISGISQLTNGPSIVPNLGVQSIPNNWAELESIEVANSQQLIDMLPLNESKGIGALLIMETQEFLYLGLEVMFDLNPYANQTYIARVRDEQSQLSKNLTKRDIIRAPTLIYISPSRDVRLLMTAPKYTNDEDLRRAFVRSFERKQIKYPVKRVWSMISSTEYPVKTDSSDDDDLIFSKLNQIYMSDLTNALRASLMEQVFRHPDLSDDQYNSLVKYIYTVINYFPFNQDEDLNFLKRLHSWLQNQVSPIDVIEYKKQFRDIDDVLPKREWVACRSFTSIKTLPVTGKKSGSLLENHAKLGKVVSNLTRLFRGQQQQASKLKGLFSALTMSMTPLLPNQTQNNYKTKLLTGDNPPMTSKHMLDDLSKRDDSPIERILKSLTSGSLGSESSILKLISSALTSAGHSGSSTGMSKFAREYPCGAWKLAHVMVVNEYIKDSPRKDVKHIVLHSLYQYMLHFYACPTCGNRVSDVAREFRLNLDEHLKEQADSVILLWKVHNRVNNRLKSEFRPGTPPKQQFPSELLCPKCRGPLTQNDLVSTPNWHEKQVMNFLVHHYRSQNIIMDSGEALSSGASDRPSWSLVLSLLWLILIIKRFALFM